MPPRWLIVNADDFGRSSGINRGIVHAHERGILTSASLMTRYPSAKEAAEYARTRPVLSVGLHFDLGEYVYEPEKYDWKMLYQVVPYEDESAVGRELGDQLESFRKLVGAEPTHLDSHQHVHRKGPALHVMRKLAMKLGVPLRQVTPGVHYCGSFHGESYDGLDASHDITVGGLVKILGTLPPGITELACHPGYPEEEMPGGYREERRVELETLCDPLTREVLSRFGVRLASFREWKDFPRE